MQHTLRLLLAGVIVGMVFGALSALVMFWVPDVMRAMQAFLLGTTGFLGWSAVALLAAVFAASLLVAMAFSRAPRCAVAGRDHRGQPGHRAHAGARPC